MFVIVDDVVLDMVEELVDAEDNVLEDGAVLGEDEVLGDGDVLAGYCVPLGVADVDGLDDVL